jgi:DNA-binding transcriptional ArsR family regulator
MTPLDGTLAALADPTRRRIVELLRDGPRRAGQLADEAAVSAPLMSRHLRTLRLHGLVEEERSDQGDNRVRMYRLRQEPFAELTGWLRQIEAYWSDQLGAFRDHIHRKQRSKFR